VRRFLWFVIILAMLLGGCGNKNSEEDTKVYLYSIKDQTNTIVNFEKLPNRILPISQEITEIVIDMVEPERILAISSDALSEKSFVREKAKKIKTVYPNYASTEKIIQLKPDLVILQETQDVTKIKTLRDMGIKVAVVSSPRDMESIKQRIISIAEIVHREENGGEIVAKMDRKLAAINALIKNMRIENRRTVLAFSSNGAFGRAEGMFDNLCKTAGITNAAANAGLRRLDHLSKEQVIELNPDYILLPKFEDKEKMPKMAKEVIEDPAYNTLKAIKLKHIILLDEKYYRYNVSQYAADAAYILTNAVYDNKLENIELFNY